MKFLVLAPHADDEVLGVGGAIIKHLDEGHEVHWVLVTGKYGKTEMDVKRRFELLRSHGKDVGFSTVNLLNYEPTLLNSENNKNLIDELSQVFLQIQPQIIYLPFPGDVHTDHEMCFNAGISASKSFRAPFVRETRVYETLSETNFSLDPRYATFRPNLYIDISKQFERKLKMVEFYGAEFREHPFPRSVESIKSLGILRGAEANCTYAEAFQILKKIES
jgi:LmbE family N-acetylglucosaminyl deacetylase